MDLREFKKYIKSKSTGDIMYLFDNNDITIEQYKYLKYEFIPARRITSKIGELELKKYEPNSSMSFIIMKHKTKLEYIENFVKEYVPKLDFNKKVFANIKAENLFASLFTEYGDTEYNRANYSFLFYAMENDNFLTCTNKYWYSIFLPDYDIHIDKVDSRQKPVQENSRFENYNKAKELNGLK